MVGAGDIVIEGVDEGIDTLVVATATGTTVRLSDYANVENLRLAAASGALDAEGTAAANVLQGSLGNNRLNGGDGDDTLSDQALADITMYGGRVAVGDRDVLDGGAGDDLLTSYGGDDTFDGGAGDDRIVVYGQTGSYGSTAASAVTVRFGLGDGHDTVQRTATTLNRYAIELEPGSDLSNVHLRTSGDAFVIELADGSSLSFASAVNAGSPPTLAADLNLSLSFADGLTLDRQTLQTLLAAPLSSTPTAGADLLLGTAGADTINALDGDDMVLAGAGDDRVDGGAGADRLSGDAGRDSLFGNAGADTLVGGAGDDLLAGGAGTDTYRFARGFGHDFVADDLVAPQVVGPDDRSVDNVEFEVGISPTDVVIYHRVEGRDVTGLVLELTATGDSVELHHSHQVFQPGQVENVRFADGTVWDLTAMNARLAGVLGTDADDVINDPGSSSVLRGYAGNDVISAYGGNDVLDGGVGNDVMNGDLGDDTYVVDSLGDMVIETSTTGGNDIVVSSIDYTLGSYVERLQLTGTAALRGTGNALANTLLGNAGANRLDGLGGADAMAGGAGDDVFVVESAGDTVSEALGEGTDSVESTVTFTLGANVENLTLFGSAKINGTGNDLGNVLVGNSAVNVLTSYGGNDRLDGGGGADSMTGGADNDTYVVDNASDKTIEVSGGGIDTVETFLAWTLGAEVERLVVTAGSAVSGTGNALANQLFGSEAANLLDGKAGVDVLLGGGGNDTLQDTNGTLPSGNSAFDGGTGNDVLKGTTAADLLAGGRGDDTLTMGGGTDVICFNRGDGLDTLNAPTSGAGLGERNDTLSIGGVGFSQLQLSRDTSDLLVKVSGSSDVLRIKSWYLGGTSQTINRLQVVVDSTSEFAPGGTDVLRSSRLCVLDFVSLVNAFDAARAANPSLVNWTPTDGQFMAARVGSSDSAAIGGTLAYRYATDGTLAQVAYSTAVSELASTSFGNAAQTMAQGGTAAAQSTFTTEAAVSEAALAAKETSASAELDGAAAGGSSARRSLDLVVITADDEGWSGRDGDAGSVISAGGSAREDASALSGLRAAPEAVNAQPIDDAITDLTESAVLDMATRAAADGEVAPPVPSMTAGVVATGMTAIIDPVIQASARIGTPESDLALTPNDGTALIDLIEGMDAASNRSTSSTADGVTTPFGLDASTQRALAQSNDRSTGISAESLPVHADDGLGTRSELDRRIQQVADAWFAPQPSPDIVLSHFDEIARGTLHARQDDTDGLPSSKSSVSYALDWQRMRAKLNGFEAEGPDAAWGWDTRSASLARGSLAASAGFDPSLTPPSLMRSNDASLPLFAGLQDGFERL
ncbi:MAG: calcium-binding protein [Caldimonas sp.]